MIDDSVIDCTEADVLRGFAHGFLGRTGGVSTGLYGSLNVGLGSGDDIHHVRENRRRAVRYVAGADARLVTCRQIHSPRAVRAGDWDDDARPEADALVTNQPGVALGILTADCAPVLFSDPEALVIGAAHAGWKGAVGGVLEATVAEMEALGADRRRIRAAIGPLIQQISYEVGPEFHDRLLASDAGNDRFFSLGPSGRPHFDLQAYVAFRLTRASLSMVETLKIDTYSNPERYFSYRRSTHAGEGDYGRQLSLIAL